MEIAEANAAGGNSHARASAALVASLMEIRRPDPVSPQVTALNLAIDLDDGNGMAFLCFSPTFIQWLHPQGRPDAS
jgi:hypothetical protein